MESVDGSNFGSHSSGGLATITLKHVFGLKGGKWNGLSPLSVVEGKNAADT
jgi:hypothetical protein